MVAAVSVLRKLASDARLDRRGEVELLLRVANVAAREGVALRLPLTATREFLGGPGRGISLRSTLADGSLVMVRAAIIRDVLREHRIGVHRFNIAPEAAERADFYIFCVRGSGQQVKLAPYGFHASPEQATRYLDDEPAVYIFRSDELKSIRTLCLRFGFFDRESKYEFARNRWGVLRG